MKKQLTTNGINWSATRLPKLRLLPTEIKARKARKREWLMAEIFNRQLEGLMAETR